MATENEFLAAQIEHAFHTRILEARDLLRPIVEGEIERGHCSPGTRQGYGGHPGKRKTTLKDAKGLAKQATMLINHAFAELDKDQKRQ